jgi:hypothetical protein
MRRVARLLKTLTGVVEAPVDAVTAAFDVNPATGMAVSQGDWWYRSELTVAADGPDRSVVTQRIFDIAKTGRFAVWFVARKPLRAAPGAFRAHLTVVGNTLGCRAYLTP